MLDAAALEAVLGRLPRKRIGFYPTPFHPLANLSAKYGVNFFMKREDLAGPGAVSGSKTHLAEFIIGRALQDGVDTIITQGAYLTNSGMQFAVACRAAGITPILYLQDESDRGIPTAYHGNLLLIKIMNVDVTYLPNEAEYPTAEAAVEHVATAMAARKAQLEAQGRQVLVVLTGGAHPDGFAAHALTFLELLEQARAAGVRLDAIYHTAGTGTALPGLLAAKFATGSPVAIRSMAICSYAPDSWINRPIIVDRVQQVFATLELAPPSDDAILAAIDIDERFIGPAYAVPSPEGTAALREVAEADGIFLGPVYTAKGFAGLLDHVRSGRVAPGSNVAFIHTGDIGNLFEIAQVVGAVAGD